MNTVKIAVTTNDGIIVSGHFGMAEYYQVFIVENGKVTSQEQRSKPHHTVHPDMHQPHEHNHENMFAPVKDCQVLISGGMGSPAYDAAVANGLEVFFTRGTIEAVIQEYLQGNLVSDPNRIHQR